MSRYLEKHKFTFEHSSLAKTLFILGILVWILSSFSVAFLFGTVGIFSTFIIFTIFAVFMKCVLPRLTKANGEGRLYENFMEIQLHDETTQIYYKDIYQLEFNPTWNNRQVPYILVAKKNNKLKISVVWLTTYIDVETIRLEKLFHAIRKQANLDVKEYKYYRLGNLITTYKAVPYISE